MANRVVAGVFAFLVLSGCGDASLEDTVLPDSGSPIEADGSSSSDANSSDAYEEKGDEEGYTGSDDDDRDEETPAPPPSPGQPPPPPPPIEALFNRPELKNSTGRYVLERALVGLIKGAPAGSTIRGSWYHFSRPGVADAFVDAKARGVNVFLTMDGKLAKEQPQITSTLRAALGKNLVLCSKSAGGSACIGSNINHNKFALFTSTGGATNVVWQSSANLTGGIIHNNAIIVRGNTTLFATYLSYFNALTKNPASPNLSYGTTVDTGGGTKVYFSPTSGSDTVLAVLDNVDCEQGKSRLRVVMAFFRASRGVKIAEKLVSLQKAKCDVEVLVTGTPGNVLPAVASTLRNGGVRLRTYLPPTPDLEGIHSKYLLIDSKYQGQARKLVFTGSHNYEDTALRTNDETLMRVDNATIFAAFEKDYAAVRLQTR